MYIKTFLNTSRYKYFEYSFKPQIDFNIFFRNLLIKYENIKLENLVENLIKYENYLLN